MTVFHTSNTVVSTPDVLHSRPYLDFGPGFYVADDKVFNTVDLYFAHIITKDEALRRLIAVRPNRKICFLTQAAIDTCLTYLRTDKLK